MSFFFRAERPTRFPRDARARNATERASASAVSPETHALTAIPSSPHPGVPWTEDEHRLFLLGLQKLGKVRARFRFPHLAFFSNDGSRAVFPLARATDARAARPARASPNARATRYRSRARSRDAPRSISRGRRHARRFVVLGTPGGIDRRTCASRSAEIVCARSSSG